MYNDFFGFSECPFGVTPDPDFVYFSKTHQQTFSNLLYGVEQRKGFMVVTGAIGTGKTSLSRVLLQYLDDRAKVALILHPKLSETQLLASIVEDFGIHVEKKNKKSYLDALNQFLLNEAEHGSTAVLILDECQNLRPSALEYIRLLSNFETNKEKLLQIILLGQPELRELLDKPKLSQLRQRITVSCCLSALDRKETEEYIIHRIMVAGVRDRPIFDQTGIDHIFLYSQGIPRLINILCDRNLLAAYLSKSAEITGEMVESIQDGIEPRLPVGLG